MRRFTPEIWSATDSRVIFVPSETRPNMIVTGVKIYVFKDNALLLSNVQKRGWDLPGGHLEPGETPEQALTRELREETGAEVKTKLLIGYLYIHNDKLTDKNSRYPRESCILVFRGFDPKFDKNHTFPSHEVLEAKFIDISDLPASHHDWNISKQQVVNFAFDIHLSH